MTERRKDLKPIVMSIDVLETEHFLKRVAADLAQLREDHYSQICDYFRQGMIIKDVQFAFQ